MDELCPLQVPRGFTASSFEQVLSDYLLSLLILEHPDIQFLFHVQPFRRLMHPSTYYDFCWLLYVQPTFTSRVTEIAPHSVQISPGKNVIFPSIYSPHLLPFAFGSMDFDLFGSLVQRMLALYEVRVPRTGGLPPTSFRFHLTVDTLVLS